MSNGVPSRSTAAFLRVLAEAVALDLEQHAEYPQRSTVAFLDRLRNRVEAFEADPKAPQYDREMVRHMTDILEEILNDPDWRRLRDGRWDTHSCRPIWVLLGWVSHLAAASAHTRPRPAGSGGCPMQEPPMQEPHAGAKARRDENAPRVLPPTWQTQPKSAVARQDRHADARMRGSPTGVAAIARGASSSICPMLHSRDACRMQHMADAVSHDQNFKNLIVDYPREALAFFAAEEAPRPEDDVRIVPVRQEQLKERLGDRYRALDAPLLVDWADGRRDAVVFALEEESDWRRFSPHRLARYCLDLGTGRRHYLVFDYLACKLAEMPAGRWLDSDNLVARVNLPNMRSPARDRVDVYARAVHGLLTLETDDARQAKYMEFIDIYAGLTDNEFRRYRRQHPQESSIVTGLIQRARAEGIERGMERGMRQGRAEGGRAVLERLLRQRFGGLSPEAAERLRRAPETELETWADNLLDAGTLDEVFRTTP